MTNAPSYKANDPRGWCGDPKRGAALGRRDVHDHDADQPIVLVVLPVRFVDGDYDINGTYWGSGEPLYWYADCNGRVDAMLRAKDRGAAIEAIRVRYPLATIHPAKHYAGEAPEIDEFVIAYATSALWSSSDADGEPLDKDHGVDDIAPEAMAIMVADCKAFRELAGDLLVGLDESQCGHDFWLTRNGHGCGFWDRGLGELGDKLTKICKEFGEAYPYADEGKIYLG